MRVDTKLVKFKAGKFKGGTMRINAEDFDPAMHEEASAARPKPAAMPSKGRGKGR